MEETLNFLVPIECSGERLDRFLASAASDLSRSRVQNLIRDGLAAVDGEPAKASRKLKAGQRVDLTVPEAEPVDLSPDPEVRFRILYQDDQIVVVDKPAGLVVHPAAGHATGTLVHGLLAQCRDLAGVGGQVRPGIVHRLDKDTSGVMVAAKTDLAHQALVDAFQNRTVEKTYLALTRSRPPAAFGRIEAPIGRHPVRRKEMAVRGADGRPAVTEYRLALELRYGVCLLRLHILTGRTHQIRVHLASLGCPVLGDAVYGGGLGPVRDRPEIRKWVKRQMLHAHRLVLDHPVTGERMTFVADLPEDFRGALAALAPETDLPDELRQG